MEEFSPRDKSNFVKNTIANLLQYGLDKNKVSIRRWIVLHHSDQKVLKEIAEKDPYPDIRAEAVKNITDNEFLSKIIHSDDNYYVQKNAIQAINDKKTLMILRLVVQPSLQPFVVKRIREISIRTEPE